MAAGLAAAISALGIPAKLWYVLAGILGADTMAKILGREKGYGIQKLGLGLQEKQMASQADIGRREGKRADEMVERLLSYQAKEKGEARVIEQSREESQRNQQTMAMLLTLMNQEMNMPQVQPTTRWPSSGMVSTLRR